MGNGAKSLLFSVLFKKIQRKLITTDDIFGTVEKIA
jgi:hypothetical protein